MRIPRAFMAVVVLVGALVFCGGCSSLRVTEPARTATEMFLLSQAASEAVGNLSATGLRDRLVYVDGSFFMPQGYFPYFPLADYQFLMGEVRAKLLKEGVRLTADRGKAEIIVEVRSGALGIDKQSLLVGLPSIAVPGLASGATDSDLVSEPLIATPEIAFLKNIKQDSLASVAIVAYWADTGELVSSSGPFIGRAWRNDWWILGYGPRTSGDIPTVRREQGR